MCPSVPEKFIREGMIFPWEVSREKKKVTQSRVLFYPGICHIDAATQLQGKTHEWHV
jgi:hypothetical protein